MRQLVGILLPVILLAAFPAVGATERPKWCAWGKDQGYVGWDFYCEGQAEPEEPEAPVTPTLRTHTPLPPEPDPREELKSIQEELEKRRALAILKPTPENLASYMAYQQEQVERASVFSDQWRRVLLDQPELDYTIRRPVSTLGKRVWQDTRREDTRRLLTSLNDRYGLFFFYTSNCAYCVAYSPILKAFATQYGIHVQAVSLDGGRLPEWPEAMVDSGQAMRLGLLDKPVPATLLFDKETRQVVPVGYGLLSQSDLEEKIYVQTGIELGQDY